MKENTFIGVGGLKIHTRTWKPDADPHAVIVICHGVNSHSGQHTWTAEQFVNDGYAVYAHDHRGRGRSEGERFYVDDVKQYVDDLAAFIEIAKAENPGKSVFLLGHSMGGVVSCTYALDYQSKIDGLICESFAYKVPAPDFALAVLKGLAHVTPHAHVLKLHNKDFSRDSAAVAALDADPYTQGEVQPIQTVAALAIADERLGREFARITLPVFILHGTADQATKPSGSQEFYDNAGSTDKTLKFYEGHFHDLLNDIGKEEVIADIKAWIGARIPVTA